MGSLTREFGMSRPVLAVGRGLVGDRAAPAPWLPGKPRVDDRRVISGILHVFKAGCR